MHRMTPHEFNQGGAALAPQNINNSAVNGDTITEPWSKGRYLTFLLVAGAMTTNDALTITVQQLLRSDGSTWSAVQDKDSNNLIFTLTKTLDGGALEGDYLFGTIDLERFDGETYQALRISAVNAAAQNVLLGSAFFISDVYGRPTGETDDLLSKQIPSL